MRIWKFPSSGRRTLPPQPPSAPEESPAFFEPLERRELLSTGLPAIVNVVADNRGQIVLTANKALDESTLAGRAIRLFTAGADNLLGTADDIAQSRDISYDPKTFKITITADLPANTRYRLVLDGSEIRGVDGKYLDGEFNGVNVRSGDGVEGGDFQIYTRMPVADEIVRFASRFGFIDIRLLRSGAPLTVQNFLNYANRGDYDMTFIHRSVENFVIQGGGFTANDDFDAIPTDPPVQNEFWRSNIRGTLAFAKSPNDPNSATSQFFFNLRDNSQNLDNQNGGFTVFAEVLDAQSLMVMDRLGAFDTVDASSEDSAFGELPVEDVTAYENRGELLVSDLISFTRVALLMDITGEPTQQIPVDGQVEIIGGDGKMVVRLFDLSGSGLLNATDFVNVRFGSNNTISQIQLLEPPANVRIGIQILGANSVGSIIDRRTSEAGEVAFILSDAQINNIKLTQRITGQLLNGYVLPGGDLLPDDIDGDGYAGDATALYIQNGFLNSLDARSGFSGDVVVPGGIGAVKSRGQVSDADFTFGAPRTTNFAGTTFSMGSVRASSIRTEAPLRSITATEWLSKDGEHEIIRAASLGKLSIKGGAGASGSFEASLDLTDDETPGYVLGGVTIKGGLFRSSWSIAGHIRSIKVGGAISQWTLDVEGSGKNIQSASMMAAEVFFAGGFGTIKTADWDGGRFEADYARGINITGNRSQNLAGNLNIEVSIANTAQQRVALGTVRAPGNLDGGEFTITRGDLRSIAIGGTMRNVELMLNNGSLPSAVFGEVYDSLVRVVGTLRSLRAVRWDGGSVSGRELTSVLMTGDRSKGIGGDLFVEEVRSDIIHSLTLQNGGDFSGNLFSVRAGRITIGGDAMNGVFSVGSNNLRSNLSIEMLRIVGTMHQMDLRTVNNVGTVQIGQMIDSGLYVGVNNISGLPDSGTGVNQQATLNLLRIDGVGPTGYGMMNSVIVAGRIGGAVIMDPQIDNFGRPFGLASHTIGRVTTRINGSTTSIGNAAGPQAFGDYQIRTGFAIPS